MIGDIGKLLRPLDYLRIKHARMSTYTVKLPIAISLILTLFLWSLPAPVPIVVDKGIVPAITGLLQILTGFYIGALAAVSTFDRPSMDEPMKGSPPILRIKRGGQDIEEELSRRRFLSLLFGYLSFLSLFLYVIGALAATIEENVRLIAPASWMPGLTWGLFGAYLFVFFNLFISTLLGLYYMTDRIHRD